MKVLVTGATGFVGAHLVRGLLRDGHEVRAFARPASRVDGLRAAGVEVRRGELTDAAAVRAAAAGCAAIVHAAAPAPRHSRPASEHRAVAVDGTRHVLDAALGEGARAVFVSTAGVVRSGGDDPASRQRDAYHAAKAEGERLLAAHARRAGTSAAVVRLTAVYGPGDRRWVRLFRGVLEGTSWCVGDGVAPRPLTYVEDAAEGLLRAASADLAPGAVYVLAAEEVPTAREVLQAVADAAGVELRLRRLPVRPLRAGAALARAALAPFGREPAFARAVDFFSRPQSADGERARREIGFAPAVPLREGVRRTLDAYRQAGWL